MDLVQKFLEQNGLPDLMQNIGIAFLTTLIPIFLFIFDLEKKPLGWEKKVILEKVIIAPTLLIAVALIFLPLFLWDVEWQIWNIDIFKILSVFYFILGSVFFIAVLFNSYHWIEDREKNNITHSGFRNELKREFLENLTDPIQIQETWNDIWQNKSENIRAEEFYFKNFFSHTDRSLEAEKFDLFKDLIRTFLCFKEKRILEDLTIYHCCLSKLLDYNFYIWSFINKPTNDHFYTIQRDINLLICYLRQYSLMRFSFEEIKKSNKTSKIKSAPSYYPPGSIVGINNWNKRLQLNKTFFDVLKKHAESILNKDTITQQEQADYLNNLLGEEFAPFFFDKITNFRGIELWKHFPREWKIRIENKNSIFSKIWWIAFLRRFGNHWASLYIDPDQTISHNTSYIIQDLFPDVDQELWSMFLILKFSPNPETIKSLIKKLPGFAIPRGLSTYSKISLNNEFDENSSDFFIENHESKFEKTIPLALNLLNDIFSVDKINSYLREVNAYTEIEDDSQQLRKNLLEKAFTKMLSILQEKNGTNLSLASAHS